MILLQIVVANLLVGLISFIGLIFFGLKFNVKTTTFYLLSFTSGVMIGATFVHLIPESMEINKEANFLPIALGIFFFFILEKFLVWRHYHTHSIVEHTRPVAATMVLTGDAIHNFIDGIIIASAFLAGPSVGISITLAIVLHEIPQELGDFGVLIHSGFSMKMALWANVLTATAALAGGVLTYFFVDVSSQLHAFILPVAAGGFLYIALADLIPQLHEQVAPRQSLIQVGLLTLGFGFMFFLHSLFS